MSTLQNLVAACQAETCCATGAGTHGKLASLACPGQRCQSDGEDPGYDDDFQRIREEVNKLSGIDTGLICTLAEKLLTTTAKDIRVDLLLLGASAPGRRSRFAEGLELLAGLLQRYGTQLHPQRERSRKPALEWLAGSRVLDSLSLWPEVVREDALRTAGALLLIRNSLETEPEASRPELNALYSALESRLMKAGGVDAVVPQNAGNKGSHRPPRLRPSLTRRS
jgi:type VI secretion system protein VasJ